MLRKESKAVSEGNGPVYQEEELGFGQPAPVDEFREIKSLLEKWMKTLDELHDYMNNPLKQFSVRLKHFLERTFGSDVMPWRQTIQQTPRLASARMAPLQQYK